MRLSYLVGLVSSGSSDLALLTRGELSEVTVVVALPVGRISAVFLSLNAMRTHILW